MELPLLWDGYAGASWAIAEISRALAVAFGGPFEWPAGIKTGDHVSWGHEAKHDLQNNFSSGTAFHSAVASVFPPDVITSRTVGVFPPAEVHDASNATAI